MLKYLFFPQLTGQWVNVNLNDYSLYLDIEPNPLLDPGVCWGWVLGITALNNANYSYGGYLEDRAHLWRGHYHKPGHTIHLGVDYNVPSHTEVHLPNDALLFSASYDKDQNGGWGGKLVFMSKDKFLLLGHMDEIVCDVGNVYKKGDVVGRVAHYPANGNWYPHLHAQCMRVFDPNVDGYAAWSESLDLDRNDENEPAHAREKELR